MISYQHIGKSEWSMKQKGQYERPGLYAVIPGLHAVKPGLHVVSNHVIGFGFMFFVMSSSET